MKVLGLILIVSSSALFGLSFTAAKKDRLNGLKSFICMLNYIKAELNTNLCPLPELMKKLYSRLDCAAADFVNILCINLPSLGEKDFETVWRQSLDISSYLLNPKEMDILRGLGAVLGKYELETQNAALDGALMLLEESEKSESLEFPQLKRLSMGVSVSVGALFAILLA